MENLIAQIARADGAQIEKLLNAVLRRYGELYPDWEVSTVTVEKTQNRSEQLDRIIALLEKMKTSP
jgi:hypothetical protein